MNVQMDEGVPGVASTSKCDDLLGGLPDVWGASRALATAPTGLALRGIARNIRLMPKNKVVALSSSPSHHSPDSRRVDYAGHPVHLLTSRTWRTL